MRLQKDSKKLKAILLAIDILLALAVAAAAVVCLYWAGAESKIPDDHYETALRDLQTRESELKATEDQLRKALDVDLTPLMTRLETAELNLEKVRAEHGEILAQRDRVKGFRDDLADPEKAKLRIEEVRRAYGAAIRQLEEKIQAGESPYKICYLTFDDGPTYQTEKFLDELARLDVKATFFTIGVSIKETQNLDMRDELLRREAREGHTVANHTYTHAYYGPLYKSVNSFMDSVLKQDELVYSVTGLHTEIVRFPSGSHYTKYREESIAVLEEAGFQWMDWIANAMDAGSNGYTAKRISANVAWQVRHDDISVVLMHDWNVNTLKSLDALVNSLRKDNYLFLPLFKESVTNGNCKPKWG